MTGGPSVPERFLRYRQQALSVIPLRSLNDPLVETPRGLERPSKHPLVALLPHHQTREYQSRLARQDEIEAWCRYDTAGEPAGIGIFTGHVSGGEHSLFLSVLDADDTAFSVWLQQAAVANQILKLTWTVKTGMGRPHIYLLSKAPVYTGILKAADGTKLADIRGEAKSGVSGGYVAAPPTKHPITGSPYVDLYGGPESIKIVEDAGRIWTAIQQAYDQARQVHAVAATKTVNAVGLPTDPAILNELWQRIERLPAKYRRAIVDGPEKTADEWEGLTTDGVLDRNRVDHAVMCKLMELGWTDAEVNWVWQTQEIGLAGNRTVLRGHGTGQDYIERSLVAARTAQKVRDEARGRAAGLNFEISEARRMGGYDSPVYYFTGAMDDGTAFEEVTVAASEMTSDQRFVHAFWVASGGLGLKLNPDHRSRGFTEFLIALGNLADKQEAPEGASSAGHIRIMIKQMLRLAAGQDGAPDDPAKVTVGWRDDANRLVWFRYPAVFDRVMRVSPRSTHQQIAMVLEGMGLRSMVATFEATGGTEIMYTLPLRAIGPLGPERRNGHA